MKQLLAAALFAAVLTAPALTFAAEDGSASAGRKVFKPCRTCHSFKPEKEMFGPHLAELFGRPAGSIDGYPYSDALKGSGIVWDADHLDKWLAAPNTFVPGTTMVFPGLPDAQDRADLIAYLKRASDR